MACTTPTDFWNDSCAIDELTYAIEHGAVGATSNPSIVLEVLKKELPQWRDRIHQIADENPIASEIEVTWRLIEELAVRGARLLEPVYERERGAKGRLSIQTDPSRYRDAEALVRQAVRFDSLARNLQVKIPVTKAGVAAIEEATCQGVNVNATVCFSVPQAIAVAEAVERGLRRRERAGQDVAGMAPVCTIMVGRLDDWLQILVKRDDVVCDPTILPWAGVAAFKKAYGIFRQRGYRARLLAAAYRHQLHWSELIGADAVLTMPCAWQKRFNASSVEVVPRIEQPVAPAIVEALRRAFADFGRAYDIDGMTVDEFDRFGPTVRTLRSFIADYHSLLGVVRDLMLPNPDLR
ncbi:MAG: transaldolase family protein [Deltaproteobacteria bacterium]|nr:transaldolase family protein [Deltaproteobacteria bacterium]